MPIYRNIIYSSLSTAGSILFDFGSSVNTKHPNSKQFLTRDIINVNRFFEKRGIEVLNMELAVEKITGGN